MKRDLDFSTIPAIDTHCHPFEATPELTAQRFLDSVSVALARPASPLNESMLLSRIALDGLATLLDCQPTLPDVIAKRTESASADYGAYVGRLFAAQRIAGLLIDPGFPLEPLIEAETFAATIPAPVWHGYRIERFFPAGGSFHGAAGDPPARSFDEMVAAFEAELDAQAQRPGFVFFKSIMAYCTGLAIGPVSEADAASAWDEHRRYGDPAEKVVRDYLFRVTCAAARRHGVPFQLHTGHTSTAMPWPKVNPHLLTPVLNEPEIVETAIVLVHGGYPFCAEAGYLTSVYPNLSLDLSLMIPWASIGAGRRILETLEAAPLAKVMYGSDGIHIPEMNWLGALVGRHGLATALGELVREEVLTAAQADDAAHAILHANAERIYDLRARAPVAD